MESGFRYKYLNGLHRILVGVLLMYISSTLTVGTTEASTLIMLSGPQDVCLEQPVDLTCDMSPDLSNNQITFRRQGNIIVMTCFPLANGQCVAATSNYNVTRRTPNRIVLNIVKFGAEDAGNWTCNALKNASAPLLIESLESPESSSLKVNCSQEENTDKFTISCEGLTSRGSPPVDLLLDADSSGFKTRKSPNLQYRYTIADKSLAGAEATCSVSGKAAKCLKNGAISVSAKCPGSQPPIGTQPPIVAIIVGGIAGLFVLLVVGDLLLCYTKNKGLAFFLKKKCGGSKGSFSTGSTSKREDKSDASKTENGAQAEPLVKDGEGNVEKTELENRDLESVKKPDGAPQPKPRTVKLDSSSNPTDASDK